MRHRLFRSCRFNGSEIDGWGRSDHHGPCARLPGSVAAATAAAATTTAATTAATRTAAAARAATTA